MTKHPFCCGGIAVDRKTLLQWNVVSTAGSCNQTLSFWVPWYEQHRLFLNTVFTVSERSVSQAQIVSLLLELNLCWLHSSHFCWLLKLKNNDHLFVHIPSNTQYATDFWQFFQRQFTQKFLTIIDFISYSGFRLQSLSCIYCLPSLISERGHFPRVQ